MTKTVDDAYSYWDPKTSVTFYGDPDEKFEDLNFSDAHQKRPNGPEIGDELCDGHQFHYHWNGERWA